MRIDIVDSGLRDATGHHNAFARRVAAEARSRGWPVAIYGHRHMDARLRAELQAVPHFSASPYERVSTDPVCGDIECFLVQNSLFRKELQALGTDITGPDVLLIVPTITEVQILGLGQWFGSIPLPSRPSCAIALMFPPELTRTRGGLGIERALYRVGLKTFAKAPAGKLAFYAETSAISATFADLCDLPIHVIPWPATQTDFDPASKPPSQVSEAPLIAFLGHGKSERGFHLLPEILSAVRSAKPETRFALQVNPDQDPISMAAADRLRTLGGEIEIIEGAIDATAFSQWVERADLLLLPYDPERYAARGSGLLIEAAAHATPVVATAGTSLAQDIELAPLAGIVAGAFTAPAIAESIGQALVNLEALRDRARLAAQQWARSRSAAAYLDAVVTALPGLPFPERPAVDGMRSSA